MPRSTNPAELSPEQRGRELARLLAAGVLRLRNLRLLREIADEPDQDSAAGGLDVQA